jgi:hypothetical protein
MILALFAERLCLRQMISHGIAVPVRVREGKHLSRSRSAYSLVQGG